VRFYEFPQSRVKLIGYQRIDLLPAPQFMTLSTLITKLVGELFLPPLSLLLIGLLGLGLLRRKPGMGRMLIASSFVGLWLLSTPIIADRLLDSLSPEPVMLTGADAAAIVILGAGNIRNSFEYAGDTVNQLTLFRLRYGATLARRFHKPILVTGGKLDGGTLSEGETMQVVLRDEFHLPARWVETRSGNTRENAQFSARILRQEGIRRIYLVSHTWHLARAIPEFEREGLIVVPAGTGYILDRSLTPFRLIPSANALAKSYFATHEWVGLFWYRLSNTFRKTQ